METKTQILTDLTEIFKRWQKLLTSLGEEQINEPLDPSNWTVKDVVAHLWFWQQASIARMEAAVNDWEPDYPEWWEMFSPDPNEDVDRTNAWNYQRSREKPWLIVYSDWKAQFQHYLELASQVPENDLFEPGRYSWMGEYTLSASSLGTLEHHREHYNAVSTWMREHGMMISR
jgi:hypothetical protein